MSTIAKIQPIRELAAECVRLAGQRHECRRRLRRRCEDEYRCRPTLERHQEAVDRDLWQLFLDLVEGREPWPLYVWGDVGAGKTYAALCLCDYLDWARYLTVRDVMDSMVAREPPWYRSWALGVPALTVLDELGMGTTDFELDAVKTFCDWRENQPAVYVSNHPCDARADKVSIRRLYDRRVASRLGAGTTYHLIGPDRRGAH